MDDLIIQIERSIENNLYFLALYVSLSIPDICAAMESDDGKASGKKYSQWFDKYLTEKYYGVMTGEICYFYRCSLLHQGRASHPKMQYSRILFVEPSSSGNIFHKNILNDALNIDVGIFCRDILEAYQLWLLDVINSKNYQNNYPLLMQRYPNGIEPYIVGCPVIG